jgi:hypothetical protein
MHLDQIVLGSAQHFIPLGVLQPRIHFARPTLVLKLWPSNFRFPAVCGRRFRRCLDLDRRSPRPRLGLRLCGPGAAGGLAGPHPPPNTSPGCLGTTIAAWRAGTAQQGTGKLRVGQIRGQLGRRGRSASSRLSPSQHPNYRSMRSVRLCKLPNPRTGADAFGRELGEAARAHAVGIGRQFPSSKVGLTRQCDTQNPFQAWPHCRPAPSSPLIALNVECGVLLCVDSRCRESVTLAAALSSICARSTRLSLPKPSRRWCASTSGTSRRDSTTTRQCQCCWVDWPRSLSSRSSRGFSVAHLS